MNPDEVRWKGGKVDSKSSGEHLGKHLQRSSMNTPWRLSWVIHVDANVLYNYLFDSEFADEAEGALSLSGKVTSKNAVNEAV